jgi:hypothetical protein
MQLMVRCSTKLLTWKNIFPLSGFDTCFKVEIGSRFSSSAYRLSRVCVFDDSVRRFDVQLTSTCEDKGKSRMGSFMIATRQGSEEANQ